MRRPDAIEAPAAVDDPRLDHALRHWGLYSHHDADIGPEVRRRAGSVEGWYDAPIWQDADPAMALPDPDVGLGETVDRALRSMPSRLHRHVLKTHYVDLFFMPLRHTEGHVIVVGARLLGLTARAYEHALADARRMLRNYLLKNDLLPSIDDL